MKHLCYSRKLHRLVAQILAGASVGMCPSPDQALLDKRELIAEFIKVFSNDNPRFNPARFRDACYQSHAL
mgnify:CR=1 FL=1